MVQVILWTLSPLYHPSCFKLALNFTQCNYTQKHGHKEVCGLCGPDFTCNYYQFHFILHPNPSKHHPNNSPAPPKPPEDPQNLFTFLGTLWHVQPTVLHIGKQSTSFPGSQVRRMAYREPHMKSYHSTAWCNPEHLHHFIFISFMCSANFLCTFCLRAVQTGSHISNRSTVEG